MLFIITFHKYFLLSNAWRYNVWLYTIPKAKKNSKKKVEIGTLHNEMEKEMRSNYIQMFYLNYLLYKTKNKMKKDSILSDH
jgi:hypothetical protein